MREYKQEELLPAVAYYRYSPGGGQTEQSIEGQRRDCTAYAKSHGYTIVHEYIDRHLTGRNDNRPAFQLMMQDARMHKFNTLIAWKNDRISRNRRDALNYKDQLKKCGVQICYAEMDIPKGPEGILMESLMDGLAEYYSAELSQKIRRGMTESAYKGHTLGSKPPFVLMVKEKKFVPDPATAPYVRWIYEQYAQGTQVKQICDTLNSKGIRTTQGNLFNKNSLRKLLRNEKYIGVYNCKGMHTENAIEPIIDRDLFDAVQARIPANNHQGRKTSRKLDYPLSGLAYCAVCGAPLIGDQGTSRSGKTYTYYSCAEKKNHRRCQKKNVRQDVLDDAVLHTTLDYVLSPAVLPQIAAQAAAAYAGNDATKAELTAAQAALQDATRRINNILAAMEEGSFSKSAAARLTALESEQARLEHQIKTLMRSRPTMTASRIEFFLESMRRESAESLKKYFSRILKIFISRVDLSDTELKITYAITKKTAIPYGTAASATSQNQRIIELNPCSIVAFSGGVQHTTPEPSIILKPQKLVIDTDFFSLILKIAS